MLSNSYVAERAQYVSQIKPDNRSANTYDSDEIDMSRYESLMFIGCVGDMAGSSTVTFSVVGTATAGGALVAVTGKAAAALTQAGSDADKQAIINLRGEDLLAQGYQYVKGRIVVAAAASDCSMLIVGIKKDDGGAEFLNAEMSELFAVAATVDPDAYQAVADFDSDYVDMGLFAAATAYQMNGDLAAAAGSFAGQWYQATDAAGAGVKAISGKSVATVAALDSPTPAAAVYTSSIRSEDLDLANGFRYAMFRLTVGDTDSPQDTSDAGVVVLAADPREGQANDNDLASVDEIVA